MNNDIKSYTDEELRKFVETICLLPDSMTENIMEICLKMVEELNIREGVYEI